MDGRSRLDDILEAVNLPYGDYCIYCEATKVNKLIGYYKSLDLIKEANYAQACVSVADDWRNHHFADGREQNDKQI